MATDATSSADELLARALARSAALRRRRLAWRWAATAAVLVVAAAVVVPLVLGGAPAPPSPRRPVGTGPATGPPVHPAALAVAPDGLYVADQARNQILDRRPDGTFTVVAGTGRAGFGGDGGPATHAELDRPGGMVVGADGTLYVADEANGRVRAVAPDGTITTVAGGGTEGTGGFVAAGTPALRADITPSAVTVGPDGLLYIATGQQVLRLEADGTLTPVVGGRPGGPAGVTGLGGPAVDASADGVDGLAFDRAGYLYLFGFNTKTLLVVSPQGTITAPAGPLGSLYPRGDGGLVAAPDGTVLAMDELGVDRLSPAGVDQIVSFRSPFHGITGFSPGGIAVGSDGTVYVDTWYGNGFTDRSALAAIRPDGTSTVLWEPG